MLAIAKIKVRKRYGAEEHSVDSMSVMEMKDFSGCSNNMKIMIRRALDTASARAFL